MLESKEITKAFGSKNAVDHISLLLEQGHVYAMLGPNGSGKTTWMKMAAGLIKPTSGQMLFEGRPVDIDSRRKIAYMSTEPFFYTWMTVKDVGAYYADFFDDFSWDGYRAMLRQMELEESMKTKTLSSGMMAKLKIAVTMARDAKVYMLDEPFNGIDLLARDNIRRCIICGRYFLLKSGVHALYCEGACPHAPGYTCRQFGSVEVQKELAKDIPKVKVKVSVPEKEIASFNPIAGRGKGVTITAEALGGKTFHSNYFIRNVQGDVLTHTYDVRFTVLNPGGELLPGMVVNVTTEADETDADNTVTVPVRCVQQGADGHQFVWLVKGDKAHRQSVEIGQTQGDRIVILSGLAEGDKIIVEGYQKVSEGSQVI